MEQTEIHRIMNKTVKLRRE